MFPENIVRMDSPVQLRLYLFHSVVQLRERVDGGQATVLPHLMVDIDRSGQMVSAARHLGVCGKAVVPTRLNDRCHLVPPQVCHEEEDDDEEEEKEKDEGLNSISWDKIFQHALYIIIRGNQGWAHSVSCRGPCSSRPSDCD